MSKPNMPPSRLQLRREVLRQRDSLSECQRRVKSAAIVKRLLAMPLVIKAHTVFTYVNFRSEVETMPLIKPWLSLGKQVCVPLTIPDESRLEAYQVSDPDRDLHPGYCQIPEPDPSRLPLVDPATIEIIVLPGSVFDVFGGRLGYGGGYYDRFISQQAPNAMRIGLAFEQQIIERLPLLPHDQRLHALITEDRLFDFTENR